MKNSIATKVTLLCLFLVLITSTLIGAIFYYSESNNLISYQRQNVRRLSNLLEPQITNDLKELSTYVEELGKDESFLKISQQIYRNPKSNSKIANFLKNNRKITGLHLYHQKNGSWNHYRANFNSKGNIKFHLKKEKSLEKNLLIQSIDKANYNQPEISDIFLKKLSKNVKDHHLPIIQSGIKFIESGKTAYLIADKNLEYTFDHLKQSSTYDSTVFLVNKKGDYLIHPNRVKTFGFEFGVESKIQQDFKVFGNFFQDDISEMTAKTGFNKSNILYAKKLYLSKSNKGNFLTLITIVSFGKIHSELEAVRFKSFILSLILMIITMWTAYVFSKILTKNLNKITDVAKRYTQGETDLEIHVSSEDEIGILANTFQGMLRQVNERSRRIRKSEEKMRESKDIAEEASKAKTILLEDLRKQKSEIEKISKEKDELMAIVSHDLKNPLAVVSTSMEILLNKENSHMAEEEKELLVRSKNSSQYALNLITDLLDLARLEGGMKLIFKKFNVNKLITECLGHFELKAQEKGIELTFEAQREYYISADPDRLSQVINNIISNALKFTKADDKIAIRFSSFQGQRKIDDSQEILKIEIEDTGIGIPKNKVSKIFDKYVQARSNDRKIGTGLGLAICKNICELHSGNIWVESEENHGSKFIITLPRLLDDTGTVEDTNEESNVKKISDYKAKKASQNKIYGPGTGSLVIDGLPKKILFVDDSEDSQLLFKMILKDFNHQIITAGSGNLALDLIKEESFDIVFMDLNMPVMDGRTAIKEIRKFEEEHNRTSLPVFAITAESQLNIEKELAKCGFTGLIAKPIKKNNLLKFLGKKSS